MVAWFRFTSASSVSSAAVNVWSYQVPGGAVSTTQANEAIQQVDAFFEAIKVYLAPATWTHGARVTTLGILPPTLIAATALTTVTTGTTQAPRQAAATFTMNTQFLGKSYRGRKYIGPLSNGALSSTGDVLDPTFVAALQTNINPFLTPTAAGAQLAVFSEKLNVGQAVTGIIARSPIRTQRRRLT